MSESQNASRIAEKNVNKIRELEDKHGEFFDEEKITNALNKELEDIEKYSQSDDEKEIKYGQLEDKQMTLKEILNDKQYIQKETKYLVSTLKNAI